MRLVMNEGSRSLALEHAKWPSTSLILRLVSAVKSLSISGL